MPEKIGVIVGRFQVPELHPGHRYLIETVAHANDHIFVILGDSKIVSLHDPFSVETRRTMIHTVYPNVHIAEIPDYPSDETWSKNLDQIIRQFSPSGDVTLYGSRKSFLEQYSGTFPTIYIAPIPSPSGTDIRKEYFRGMHSSLNK